MRRSLTSSVKAVPRVNGRAFKQSSEYTRRLEILVLSLQKVLRAVSLSGLQVTAFIAPRLQQKSFTLDHAP